MTATRILLILVWFLGICPGSVASAQPDPLVGTWKATDPKTGGTSIIETYIEGDSLSARILHMKDSSGNDMNIICDFCPGDLKDKPIKGMRFIWGLRKEGSKWIDGKVVNLQPGLGEGVIASCQLERVGNKARIRGRWGIFFGSSLWDKVGN